MTMIAEEEDINDDNDAFDDNDVLWLLVMLENKY